jgi:hypothetical protein
LSVSEEIIEQYIGMQGYQKEKPPIFGAKNGTTVRTNKRIIFLRSRIGVTSYSTIEKIEEDLKKKDSFQIKLIEIFDVEADVLVGLSYLRIGYKNNGITNYASFWGENYSAGTIMSIASAIKKEPEKKEKDSEEIIDSRDRILIQIDQTHDQAKKWQTALMVALKNVANTKGCQVPIILTNRRKDWEKEENLRLSKTVLLTSLGTKSKKYKPKDVNKIKNYVLDGGVFFLTPEPDNDPPNTIAENLGVKFIKKSIVDKENNDDIFDDHIIVEDFTNHPINNDISKVLFGHHGCYPIILQTESGDPLAYSSIKSIPPRSIVAATVQLGKGLVIVVGQNNIFEDDFIPKHDNYKWLQNMFDFALLYEKNQEKSIQESIKIMKFCTNCGSNLNPTDIFCGECGTRISS